MSRCTARTALLSGSLLTALVLGGAPAAFGEESPSPSPSPIPSDSAAPSPDPSPMPASPLETTLTLSANTTKVLYGVRLGLLAALSRADGSPVADALVTAWSRTQGQNSRVKVAEGRTNEYGRVQFLLTPRTSAEYQVRFGGDALTLPDDSNVVSANVQPRLSAAFNPAAVPLKQASVLSGRLAPAYAGARISISRRQADGTFRDIAIVGADSTGFYRWSVTPGLVGSYVFKAALPAQPAYLAATTAPVSLQVDPRQLRQGDSGGDVLSLERRLAAQKADVGKVDGVFDYDLKHALTAFQKSQGIARTGVYDRSTSARLAAPVAVKLRYPKAGRAVEIDLRKQVLYLSENGVLRRIVDISSGSNELYESEGVTYRATTPLGSFRIQRKIDGVRVSRLGELYRPAYFYSGWAIHGSNSVPTYNASHGCIRVTNSAQDRLFSLLTIGTPVTIYPN
ncbi:MAG: L,D-transpeptidase family protein [Actinobacteria bacterium]|nr:L,D-transpeptidase family protein [Actinomycetota bacterium]